MTQRSFTSVSLSSLTLLFLLCLITSPAVAQSTAFTYQGKLTDGGNLANGNYDFQFALFDTVSNGTQIGTTQALSNVAVTNGAFIVTLDFGACPTCFNGSPRFLQISLRPAGSPNPFFALSPRQQISSTPYAVKSLSAATADNATLFNGQSASGFIQNGTTQQGSTNFNISGSGTAAGTLTGSIVNAVNQVNINGLRAFTVNGASNDGMGTVFTATNTFAGEGAGINNTPDPQLDGVLGKFNSFVGAGAGQANTTGFFNTFFGTQAGQANTTGNANAFFGFLAGTANATGTQNAFFGNSAGQANTTGAENAFFGTQAGSHNTTGSQNTFIGILADFSAQNPTGNNNTLLGSFTTVTSGVSNGTAIGANASVTQSNSLVLGNGVKVGIGTTSPLDKLHVVGDIRVGTGTTGCVKDADATVIAGTCSSDARFKRDIVPFADLLDKVAHLQPVHFHWRADEFKDRHFGTKPSFGLIAQEVEKVLPELVTEDEQGYKAVNYSKLPLLTLQAVRELKAENDQLKKENEALRQHQQSLEMRVNALTQLVCKTASNADICKP